MNDAARGERLQIMLTQDELEALDNWRFTRRMPSRAAAVRELLKRGLAAEGMATPEGRTRSQDFGIINSPVVREENAPDERALDGHGADGGDGVDGRGL
jgi:hypothetical protein